VHNNVHKCGGISVLKGQGRKPKLNNCDLDPSDGTASKIIIHL